MNCNYSIINLWLYIDFPTANVPLGIAIESFTPDERHRNQQQIPQELDIWNVIVAFQHSFRLLFRYLGHTLNTLIEDIKMGSLSITVKCTSLQILEGLWEDYISGHLNMRSIVKTEKRKNKTFRSSFYKLQ